MREETPETATELTPAGEPPRPAGSRKVRAFEIVGPTAGDLRSGVEDETKEEELDRIVNSVHDLLLVVTKLC